MTQFITKGFHLMREKFNKILLSIFMVTNIAQASSTDGITKLYQFVGIQGGISDYDGISAPTVSVKYGQQSPLWRTAISYNFAKDSDNTFQSIIAQVDRGVLTELFESVSFKPYIGFSLGVIEHRNSNNKVSSDRGYLYGLNTGVNYILNNDFDLDLSYRYMWSDQLKYIENTNNLSLSLHYYFD